MITVEQVRDVLLYSPDTGQFVWRTSATIAGGPTDRGYWRIAINGKRYLAHRLAWLYMRGEWPTDQIDHINGNRSDNSWLNLRAADNSQNSANSKRYSNNSSGVKGVCWDAERQKWQAYITTGYRRKFLGRFDSRDAAAAGYANAASEHFGEFARVA